MAITLDKDRITATGITREDCFSLLWQDIESIENYGILLFPRGAYGGTPEIVICRKIIIYPHPCLRKKDKLKIENIVLKDYLDDVLKTITDYWLFKGKTKKL